MKLRGTKFSQELKLEVVERDQMRSSRFCSIATVVATASLIAQKYSGVQVSSTPIYTDAPEAEASGERRKTFAQQLSTKLV